MTTKTDPKQAAVTLTDLDELAHATQTQMVPGSPSVYVDGRKLLSLIAAARASLESRGDAWVCGACGCTQPDEVTGGWRCSKCKWSEPECTCYELTGGHQPGCHFNRNPVRYDPMPAPSAEVAEPVAGWVPELGDVVRFKDTPPGSSWYTVRGIDMSDGTALVLCNDGHQQLAGWCFIAELEPTNGR